MRVLKAAASLPSLDVVVRTGDGDVARNNIKFAASLSVGAARGVLSCLLWPPPTDGGVWLRKLPSVARDEGGKAAEKGGAFCDEVRAEDWLK